MDNFGLGLGLRLVLVLVCGALAKRKPLPSHSVIWWWIRFHCVRGESFFFGQFSGEEPDLGHGQGSWYWSWCCWCTDWLCWCFGVLMFYNLIMEGRIEIAPSSGHIQRVPNPASRRSDMWNGYFALNVTNFDIKQWWYWRWCWYLLVFVVLVLVFALVVVVCAGGGRLFVKH